MQHRHGLSLQFDKHNSDLQVRSPLWILPSPASLWLTECLLKHLESPFDHDRSLKTSHPMTKVC